MVCICVVESLRSLKKKNMTHHRELRSVVCTVSKFIMFGGGERRGEGEGEIVCVCACVCV